MTLKPLRTTVAAVENALELLVAGRLSQPYYAPHEVVRQRRNYAIRHYGDRTRVAPGDAPPVLLVPPLMIVSEVYDIDPSMSAVQALLNRNMDVWLIDFGSPEQEEGGMQRTFRDHLIAVNETIDAILEATGRNVHLVGYSQGGMFVYEVAAFRRSGGVASIITFGAPVDFDRNIPLRSETAGPALRKAVSGFQRVVDVASGFTGNMTGFGFRAFGMSKEPAQLVQFVRKLHDRAALEQQERRRRFLYGEGFVGFPGPALQDVIENVVLNNRMLKGGLVIDGKTVSLVDLTCPVLYFVGANDVLIRRESAAGIVDAAPDADCYEYELQSGHFGLVVSRNAAKVSWPLTADWINWIEGTGPKPTQIKNGGGGQDSANNTTPNETKRRDNWRARLWSRAAAAAASRASEALRRADHRSEELKWQAPRVQRMQRLGADTQISVGALLAEQAENMPDGIFFLWKDRAFSYGEANRRVDAVVRGLIHSGVQPKERVAILMGRRPSYLTAVAALNRLGAIPVLLDRHAGEGFHKYALATANIKRIVADPDTAPSATESFRKPVLVLGGGSERPSLPEPAIDLERIDPETVPLPEWYVPNPGSGSDVALILFTGGHRERSRPARITNQRWAFSALGGATLASLTARDTVYCCTSLSHPTGIMVSVGAALVGGARLALADRFEAGSFWNDVRHTGATVVFHAGEMGRELLNVPVSSSDRTHPVRLMCGSGMRQDTWRKLLRRFGPMSIVESYGSTEGNALIANVTGTKIGSVGRPVPGSVEIALVRYDMTRDDFVRSDDGHLIVCSPNEEGILVSQVDALPATVFEGYSEVRPDRARLIHGAFRNDDTWFNTRDVMRRDEQGDYWFVGRLHDMLQIPGGQFSARAIEEALCHVEAVRIAAVLLDPVKPESGHSVAAIRLYEGASLDVRELQDSLAALPEPARPRRIYVLDDMPVTNGFRPLKWRVARELQRLEPSFHYRADAGGYS